ncbi:MAG: M20 family metallo-hydrolase [Bacteroidia bacterium]|nr:M20 family metallo-hydrolase [Bacteroidia bacterium]
MNVLSIKAIELLKSLILTPSLSREEQHTAVILQKALEDEGIPTYRKGNNVWAKSKYWEEEKAVILLNSHHDTVKPNPGWKREPFKPTLEGDTLYGLGSNDAGGPLVSLWATFLHFYDKEDLPFKLLFAATAEEEISGPNGVASILEDLGKIDLGIIGEPTQMHLAIAEKGLMVIDCETKGKAGHAARNEGVNAIYKAMEDIEWFQNYRYEKESPLLGPIKMSVTQIQAGSQHNVVPASCTFVVDVRTNECYSNKEVAEIIQKHVDCEVKARSFRLNSSGISEDHPVVKKAIAMGRKTYGSPTLSDQALIPYTTVKIGPGDSARSHTADEYIHLYEIEEGIRLYIELLDGLKLD